MLGYAKSRPWIEHRWFPPEVFLEVLNEVRTYCVWLCTIHIPHCGYQYKLYRDIVPKGQVEVI